MKRLGLLLIVLMAVGCSAGCLGRSLNLPPNFVRLQGPEPESYVLRGISADGVMVALRTERNPENGSLDFWTEAVTRQMVAAQGYKATGSEVVVSDGQLPGRLLTFATRRQGVDFTYGVAVFVQGGDLFIAEAGGRTEAVEPKWDAIRKALLSLR